MIKIAVCDDEVTTLHQTKKCLEEYPLELHIETFESGEALLGSKDAFEIILLDVDMKGMNGIETAKKIREKDKKVKIIYLTNYSDYITFAFAVHAFAYLLKPLQKEQLFGQLDEALEYMQVPEQDKIQFDSQEGIVRILPKDILAFEYQDHVVSMRTTGSTYHLRTKISRLADQIKGLGFEMPHKSFIVNLYAVKKIAGYDIYLTDDTVVPLSQKKSAEFRKALNRYLSDRGGKRI